MRAIYLFKEHGKQVRVVDIARYLGLARSTVSERVTDLRKAKFIIPEQSAGGQNKDGGIILTKKGVILAKHLTYKHRLIEVFLCKILHMDPKKVHKEAHRLEHAFSDEVIARLAKFLGNPSRDPHGEKIVKV